MSTLKFAVLGHPNEGKSSVVSTLTENERIRISPTPGETVRCNTFTIEVEDGATLEIIDTPGFQNPTATLAWFEQWQGHEAEMVDGYIEAHRNDPAFHHDLELMIPLKDRAGILYVADASRPLRESDRKEMEILRLIGLPRLALLNFKRDNRNFLPEWEEALKRRFNLIREFNAHQATFHQRMELFDALQHLVPDQASALKHIQNQMQENWQQRLQEAVSDIEAMLLRSLRHQVKLPFKETALLSDQQAAAIRKYQEDLKRFETQSRKQLRRLYRHDTLPGDDGEIDLVSEELFAEKVWKLLGLSRQQLMMTGLLTGAAAGVGADLATGGISFGVFTAGGALLGGIGAWIGAPKLGNKKIPFPGRRKWASEKVVVGPTKDPQLMFILLDRSLLYLFRLMNWAHARRDHETFLSGFSDEAGLVRAWPEHLRKLYVQWMKAHSKSGNGDAAILSRKFRNELTAWLSTQSREFSS
ncbi:GTPase/DUF3482 domain-containing protein [Kiritimatiellaeota bacterium B1221]|nr:GTPase/DUF3482 domain-containing protein [Kiritimatiellaeota bacterium B1221]